MKILLIDPTKRLEDGRLLKTGQLLFPSLALPLLAALTPPDIEVSICVEQFEDVDFDQGASLVGITSYSHSVLRGYEVADEFRRRGVHVVMGGMHVSMEPEEALQHADTVIVGEADELWPRFLDDFRRGAAQRIYRCHTRPSLRGLPVPRFSLLKKERYFVLQDKGILPQILPMPLFPVQTARGCPHSCSFCSVSLFSGTHYRPRPIDEVVNEIKAVGAKGCFFVDDNVFADSRRAKDLFRALIPLNIVWKGQATLYSADDQELLKLARASGCRMIVVGMESISRASLGSINKSFNRVENYARQLAAYNEAGISVMACMMFGLPEERSEVFRDTCEFLMNHRVAHTMWFPLEPLPGTPLYRDLRAAGRLKNERWWLDPALCGRLLEMKFTGLGMSEEDFARGFRRYFREFYSLSNILKRTLLPPQKGFLGRLFINLLIMRRPRLLKQLGQVKALNG